MLFNSYEFIFIFFPLFLLALVLLKNLHQRKLCALVFSFFFIYQSGVESFLVLFFSATINYFLGQNLIASRKRNKTLLVLGITLNLMLLGFYKYSTFIYPAMPWKIILPLAISFYTFKQIAYLIDCYQLKVTKCAYTDYLLCVSFFPELVAGPVVHFRQLIHQFEDKEKLKLKLENFSLGLTLFIIGLSKKVIIADTFAPIANNLFTKAKLGEGIEFFTAWTGVLSYTFQLYFDFSGYSDMAISLALMLGIELPKNFNSPYKAINISDFWRRWHMTLSQYLKEYLYIPLGGNRVGILRENLNLFLTMLLGGIWHGAGWNFICWGAYHGILLVIYHNCPFQFPRKISMNLTFLFVALGWVFFRAENLPSALKIYHALWGGDGFILATKYLDHWGSFAIILQKWGIQFNDLSDFKTRYLFLLSLAFLITHFMPNSQEIVFKQNSFFTYRPSTSFACFASFLFCISLLLLEKKSIFLYFHF